MSTKTSRSERPRDRLYLWALDRIFALRARATTQCQEPACDAGGGYDHPQCCQDSQHCGERLMAEGWRRELQAMRDLKDLVEVLERREIERAAAERHGRKR